MEILNSYTYSILSTGTIIYICFIIAMFIALIAYCISDSGIITVITTLVVVAACAVILVVARSTTTETRYQGYITNWEEYCEQYDTISVEGKLITAKLKEAQE